MRIALLSLFGLVLVAAAGVGLVVTSIPHAVAAGPCGTSHDALDADEAGLLAHFQAWRDDNLANSSQLNASGPLNAAAAWFAEYVASGGPTNGHSDKFGRDYFDRALDCGWPYLGGMGEGGVYTESLAEAAAMLPQTSVANMQVPPTPNYPPVKCAGVGRATVGNTTVWIVLLAQFPTSQECPQALNTSPEPSPSPTPTASPSPTSTASPTPSPTPTPTPQTSWNSWAPGLTATD
jgi:hypothetical protein